MTASQHSHWGSSSSLPFRLLQRSPPAVGAQLLIVREDATVWAAEVVDFSTSLQPACLLQSSNYEIVCYDLNPFNHCGATRGVTPEQFCQDASAYCRMLVTDKRYSKVYDAITDNTLDVKDQLILIGLQRERGVRRAEFEDMRTVRDLAEILRPVTQTVRGDVGGAARAYLRKCGHRKVLVNGAAAVHSRGASRGRACWQQSRGTNDAPNGATAGGSAAVGASSSGSDDACDDDDDDANSTAFLIVAYVRKYYAAFAATLEMALELRAAVVLIDGVDEASGRKEQVEEYVLRTLVPMGVRVVMTSRPNGVRLEALPEYYQRQFVVFDLEPLDDAQRLRLAKAQLNEDDEFVANLLQFGRIRAGHDDLYRRARDNGPAARSCARRLERASVPNQIEGLGAAGEVTYNADMRQRRVGVSVGRTSLSRPRKSF